VNDLIAIPPDSSAGVKRAAALPIQILYQPQGRRSCWRRSANLLVFVFLSLACPVSARAASTSNARRITVVIRVDDYRRSCSDVGTELLAILQKHSVPCTYGVVPYTTTSGKFSSAPESCVPLDKETAAKLDDAVRSGLVEVAQHGFTHADNGGAPGGHRSEFWGRDYSTQLRMLSAGKAALESLYHVNVTTFIPPWNKCDENTLRALESSAFRVISSDASFVQVSGHFQKLRFLPYTCDPGNLKEAVGAARKSPDAEPIVVVLFHFSDFVGHDHVRAMSTYQSFEDLLSWLAAQPDVATLTLGEAANLAQDMGHERQQAFTALRPSQTMTPALLRTDGITSFYPSTRLALSLRSTGRRHFFLFGLLLCFLLIAVTAVLVGLAVSPLLSRTKPEPLRRIANLVAVSAVGLGVLCIIAVLSHHAVRYRGVVVLVGLLGACLGVCVAASVRLKRTPGK
jgi:hypothetical protein